MTIQLPYYLFNSLIENGNVVISKQLLKRVGQKRIIELLRKQGVETELYVSDNGSNASVSFCRSRRDKLIANKTYILERKG
ncbi:MAG: hypothetical protein RR617_08025 [Anaerovoracaceae bacterium]